MTTVRQIPNQRNPIQLISNIIRSFVYAMNGRWHKLGMQIFMIVTIAHISEHIIQAYQLWGLGWPRPECLGLLGLWKPWLMRSEWLHYGHALFMLLGLAIFRPSFHGKARLWWDLVLGLQFYHHFEHALLLGQAVIGQNLWDSRVPISIGQIWFPRLELHLFYNLMVLIPMMIAMYYHRFPPMNEGRLV
jgi:hypothetical protein